MAEVWIAHIKHGDHDEDFSEQDYYCATHPVALNNAVRHLTAHVFPRTKWCDGDRQMELISQVCASQQRTVRIDNPDGNDDWIIVDISRYKLLEE